jgi:hypothetical protein
MKILVKALVCLILVTTTSCNQKESQKKTPEELKSELRQQEQTDPLSYLSISKATLTPQRKEVRKKTLFKKAKYENDGATINGVIENKATLAKFKDVKLKVTYYSITNSIISEKYFIFYEYYSPNSKEVFNIKDYPPQSYNRFNVEVVEAKGD